MSTPPSRSFFRLLAFALIALPLSAFGQSNGSQPAEERGWGSTWLQPATEQQRQWQAFFKQYSLAKNARNYSAALKVCDQAIQKQPDQASWYGLRSEMFGRLRQFDRAMADLDHLQALAQERHLPALSATAFYFRARIHQEMDDYPAALTDLQSALRTDARHVSALNGLAWLRATSPDASVRNGPEGVRLAQKAVTLKNVGTCALIDTLAAAYAEAGDYPRAIESEQRAIAAAPKELRDPNRAQDFQTKAVERLHLFEQHQPYHAPLDED